MKIPALRTLWDVTKERHDDHAIALHRALVRQNKLNSERHTLGLYPEIGILMRRGKTIFYAFVSGQYLEHSDCDVIARKLGPMRITRQQS